MAPQCYLNGAFLPVSEAKIGVYDLGLLRGFGIYEALTTFGRTPFRMPDHMERFRRSATSLHIEIPVSDAEMAEILTRLIESNIPDGKEAVIRIVLTGGEAIDGLRHDPKSPTLYVLVEELAPLPREVYESGTSVTVFDFQRQFPESKTTNYIQAVMLQDERVRAGAIEILYTAHGQVLECATSNFFTVKDGVLITAKDNILYGITRKVTLELARALMPVEERDVSVEEMYAADEAFLTSSFKDIVPVVKVGERVIGDGRVGPHTKKLIEAFHEYAHAK
ncbi:MAG: branched-chain amino acid aminotransferase [Parcubacteria group bacterium Athens0416_74]|nr:MAG: branched-chain amino acid aminotransferase [Parcubacteria group bacterium Athens0416_74]